MYGVSVFFDLKVGNEFLRLKMLKKFDNGVSGVKLFMFVCAFQFAFFENIVKSNGRCQVFMKFNLADTTGNVFFQRDDKWSVVLVRYIQKSVRVTDDLAFSVGNIKKRRISFEENNAFHNLSVNFRVDDVSQ